ncbi:TM1266 family iron-only hydrogenase system putative regulator [Desulfocurvus sp.]|jgi:putative iron-only hydrogenase system regulator|uniref:TM1266 family iron-only hydrogenase system putative regulator n=1 Tax=Desulfocurvus sp. TaxID=2871698 RepID=UPI0025C1D327|nr:TM1266 family iron-only hydrogenase system putative regulator [Desulfocurvus sp.]MCK9241445.1 iron-only hydrogenase system regulator [Desulfocurvus sp.]
MEKRIGVVGLVVGNRAQTAPKVNDVLTAFGELIVARVGLPYKERNVSVISLIVEATTDELGAMTGKLGMLPGVQVKSLMV